MTNLDEAMGTAMGFMKTRVLLTAAELDLFTRIDEGKTSAAALAQSYELDGHATERLLDALAAVGFLEKDGERYLLGEQGVLFSARRPDNLLPWLLHMSRLWQKWGRLTETVKWGSRRLNRPEEDMDPESRKAFIGAMHVVARALSMEIVKGYDAGGSGCLLDVGGASGTYTIAFLRKYPSMRAVIFDLPPVIPLARARLEQEGILDRVTVASGDFYRDELPQGCDLALLSAIIHQNSPEQNVELYGKAFRALQPGGKVLVRDHIMDPSRTRPPAGALFAINMLVNTEGGDTYTLEEVTQHLEAAGFRDVRLVRQGERMDCLVEAKKPI